MTETVQTTQKAVPLPPVSSRDAAWVRVPAPLPAATVAELCKDVEAVFRLNPYYDFRSWRQTGPAAWIAEFANLSNQTQNALTLEASQEPGQGFSVRYDHGIKKGTIFSVEPTPDGCVLTVTDDYEAIPEAERQQRLADVDKSLAAWGEALRVYFRRLKRWSWLPGWRWYIRRVWIPMKPSARRIVWWLYLITIAEFFFFLFVLAIYLIEQKH